MKSVCVRRITVCLLIATAVFVGCLGVGQEDPEASGGLNNASDPASSAPGETPDGASGSGVSRSALETGTAYTYEVDGLTANPGTLTLVVQPSTDHAYLLAGGNRTDLAGEIVHDRPWMGPVDNSLNSADSSSGSQLFAWPLSDGKSWTYQEDTGLEVTAHKAQVTTTDGKAPGFRMSGRSGNVSVNYTYTPSVGYLTSYTVADEEVELISLELVEVSTSQSAVWFQPGPQSRACSAWAPNSVKRIEPPGDADSLLAAGWSSRPGQAILHPPPSSGGDPLVQEHGEADRWIYDLVASKSGPWTMATKSEVPAEAGGGRVCLTAIAVSWTDPGESP